MSLTLLGGVGRGEDETTLLVFKEQRHIQLHHRVLSAAGEVWLGYCRCTEKVSSTKAGMGVREGAQSK